MKTPGLVKRAAKTADPAPPPAAGAVESQTLLLAETLDLAAASALAQALLAARGSDITIRASEVRHLGGQCAQVLVSAAETWRHDRTAMRIVDSSADFLAGAQLLGLGAALDIKDIC